MSPRADYRLLTTVLQPLRYSIPVNLLCFVALGIDTGSQTLPLDLLGIPRASGCRVSGFGARCRVAQGARYVLRHRRAVGDPVPVACRISSFAWHPILRRRAHVPTSRLFRSCMHVHIVLYSYLHTYLLTTTYNMYRTNSTVTRLPSGARSKKRALRGAHPYVVVDFGSQNHQLSRVYHCSCCVFNLIYYKYHATSYSQAHSNKSSAPAKINDDGWWLMRRKTQKQQVERSCAATIGVIDRLLTYLLTYLFTWTTATPNSYIIYVRKDERI